MRFFWPNKLNPDPGVFTRLGRVIHWIGTAGFLFMFLPALFYLGLGAYQYTTNAGWTYGSTFHSYWEGSVGIGIGAVTMALVIYFAGRALRYILSGE